MFHISSSSQGALIAGHAPVQTETLTLAEGRIARGAILGQVLGPPVAEAADSNVGDGTIPSVTAGVYRKPGTYVVACIEAIPGGGHFTVEDPEGRLIGAAAVGSPFVGPVNFTITAGVVDFAAGDRFTIRPAPIDTRFRLCSALATDGSQLPRAIASHEADATAGPVPVIAYVRGDFDESQCTVGAGLTVADVRDAFRAHGVLLRSVARA